MPSVLRCACLVAFALGVSCGGRSSLLGGDVNDTVPDAQGGRGAVGSVGGLSQNGGGTLSRAGQSSGGATLGLGGGPPGTQGGAPTGEAGESEMLGGGGGAPGTEGGAPTGEAGAPTGEAGACSDLDCSCPTSALGTCVASIAVGYNASVALLKNGDVMWWGDNYEYGGEGYLNFSKPLLSKTLSGVTSLAIGTSYTCALLADTTVSCWGDDPTQALSGGGSKNFQAVPTPIPGLTGAIAIAASAARACAILGDHSLTCWGTNPNGELGNGSTTVSTTPVAVSGLTGVTAVSLGLQHSCAMLDTGKVACWGNDNQGQLGDGAALSMPIVANINVTTPAVVPGLSGVAAISLGRAFSCALLESGKVSCWGSDTLGELGDGNTKSSSTPALVPGLSGVTAIAAGWNHVCALLQDRTVSCWGDDHAGQIGNGLERMFRVPYTPSVVPGLSGVAHIGSGQAHTCVLTLDKTIKCWGSDGYGELGDLYQGAAYLQTYSSTPLTVTW